LAEGDLGAVFENLSGGLVGAGEGGGVEVEDGLVGMGVEGGCDVEEFWGVLLGRGGGGVGVGLGLASFAAEGIHDGGSGC
jgi:hypothetical protein